jgi:hypothetical protein
MTDSSRQPVPTDPIVELLDYAQLIVARRTDRLHLYDETGHLFVDRLRIEFCRLKSNENRSKRLTLSLA